MRIIGGQMKGRRLNPNMKNWRTRPTTDQAKEGLFNILNHQINIQSCRVLDLFSGSGSVGLEFISRGADVSFVEKFKPCTRFIKDVLTDWGLIDHATLYTQDVTRYLQQETTEFDIIFGPSLDSNYHPILTQIFTRRLLKKDES